MHVGSWSAWLAATLQAVVPCMHSIAEDGGTHLVEQEHRLAFAFVLGHFWHLRSIHLQAQAPALVAQRTGSVQLWVGVGYWLELTHAVELHAPVSPQIVVQPFESALNRLCITTLKVSTADDENTCQMPRANTLHGPAHSW
jgi:hypothetical protein